MGLCNNMTISGTMYNKKESQTKSGRDLTTFSLGFYNGKSLSGESQYAFIDCRYFGKLDIVDRSKVCVSGWLAADVWTQDNVKRTKHLINCRDVQPESIQPVVNQEQPKEEISVNDVDDIPF